MKTAILYLVSALLASLTALVAVLGSFYLVKK